MSGSGVREEAAVPSICVFGGSRAGRNPGYVPAAVGAGRLIARAGYGLVYGGGPDGIMGAVAEGAWAEGGTAIGVIPGFMREREGNDDPRLDVRLVETLAERKTLMADLSAGFLVLPGGLGTYDELFEAITWSQLGVQAKNVSILNVDGFYTPLARIFEQLQHDGFVTAEHLARVLVTAETEEAIAHLTSDATR